MCLTALSQDFVSRNPCDESYASRSSIPGQVRRSYRDLAKLGVEREHCHIFVNTQMETVQLLSASRDLREDSIEDSYLCMLWSISELDFNGVARHKYHTVLALILSWYRDMTRLDAGSFIERSRTYFRESVVEVLK